MAVKTSDGVTPPITWISNEEATHEELQDTARLKDVLTQRDVFATKEELSQKWTVVAKLDDLARRWIRDVSIIKNVPQAETVGGNVYTFGSFRLGVHTRGGDIDALLVAPCHVDRSDFFSSFVELLSQQSCVRHILPVQEAFVPVIKMECDKIKIDMLFARLHLGTVPSDLHFMDESLLANVSKQCLMSLNGCRGAQEIIKLVPDIEQFRLTLLTIKVWAKHKGIYSNVLGYLGGVSWTILVAHVCQLYPRQTASSLVNKFFTIYTDWDWRKPVLLKQLERPQFWNPLFCPANGRYLMPIMTPTYPEQNSTFNVSLSTKAVMISKFKEGLKLMKDIATGKSTWDALFETPNFFATYSDYIVIVVRATSEDNQLQWASLVESKIRQLIKMLESNQYVSVVHINPRSFFQNHPKNGEFYSRWFIGLAFNNVEHVNLKSDFAKDFQMFAEIVNSEGVKTKILKEGMTVQAVHIKRADLDRYLSDEDILKIPTSATKQQKDSTLKNNSVVMRKRTTDSNARNSTF